MVGVDLNLPFPSSSSSISSNCDVHVTVHHCLDKLLLLYLPVVPIIVLSTAFFLTTMLGAFKRRWKTRSGNSPKKSKEKPSSKSAHSKVSPKCPQLDQNPLLLPADERTKISSGWTSSSNSMINSEFCPNNDCDFQKNEFDDDTKSEENNMLIESAHDLLDNCKETHIIEDSVEIENTKDFTNGNYNSNEIQRNLNDSMEEREEKTDCLKEALENEIGELQAQLQIERNNVKKEQDKVKSMEKQAELAVSKENLMLELQQERALRYDTEKKLEEMRTECDNCRSKVAKLQDDFKKMEDIVRGIPAYKARFDQMKMEKISTIQAYETRIKEYEMFIETLQKDNLLLAEEFKALEAMNKSREEMQEKGISQLLLQRVRFLEEQNTTLMLENTHQRHQYEQCLDDVANQVVQALLAQKTNCSFARYSFPGASKACINERIDVQQYQSDHSSESLASMCSDYSVISSSSSTNALRNYPGHQQPYSPSAWFHEVDMWPESHKTPSDCSSSFRSRHGCNNFRNKQYNPGLYSGDDKISQFNDTYQKQSNRSRDNNQGHINNLNHLESQNQNVFETIVRRHHMSSDSEFANERPNSSSLHTDSNPSHPYKNFTPASECNQSPSEFFDSGLDAVETPNDDVLAGDNLELSLPDQKIFKDKDLTVSAAGDSISEQSLLLNSSNSLQRPTSLNLASEQREDELNELKCLKCKNHEPNNDGNVYVEPNKTITQVLNMCQVNTSHQLNNSSNQNNFDKSQFISTATISTPIVHNIHVFANSSTPYFNNNTSAECNESIGKDEGYSTMSSDVQGEPFVRSTESAFECNECGKQTHPSGIERKAKNFHDFINKEEMKEICEEEELEDNCTNFARELATSIVKQQTDDQNLTHSKLDPKSTRDLLSARSNKYINLFSPQGFKNKSETSPTEALSSGEEILQNSIKNNDPTAVSYPELAENKYLNHRSQMSLNISTSPNSLERSKVKSQRYLKNYTKNDFKNPSSNLFRANSDSKIWTSQKIQPPNCSESVILSGQKLPLLGMTCSVDEILYSHRPVLKTPIKRSQCQVLNRIQSDSSLLANRENNQCSNSKVTNPQVNEIANDENETDFKRPKAAQWIWEWEPLNSSEEVSDLNGTDSGFFITSLPPLPKIEDFKISSKQDGHHLNNLSDTSNSNVNLLIGSSPELSRRCNSPIEKFQTSSLQRPKKKKIASVSPYKYSLNDSRTDMNSTPRLSWCSEELNLTGTIPLCDSLVNNSSIKSNSNHVSTGSYYEISQQICDVGSDKGKTEIEDSSTIALALDLETKFTSDFYRLCPADSNRSLTKSRNNIDDTADSRLKEPIKDLKSQFSKNHSVDLHKNIAMVALKKQVSSPKKQNDEFKPFSKNNVNSDTNKEISKVQKESVTSLGTKIKLKNSDHTSVLNPSSPSKRSPLKSPSKCNSGSAIPVMKKLPTTDSKLSNETSMGVKRKITHVKEQKNTSPKKESPKKEQLCGSPVKPDCNKKWRHESKIPTRDFVKVKPQINQVSNVQRHRSMPAANKINAVTQKSTSEQIEELNKMISACGDSDEVLFDVKPKIPCKPRRSSIKNKRTRKKKEGCETSWVHVEADVDLSDPKARANLLDSMLASSSSSSDESSDECTIAERQHLHALHRFRRRKRRADFDKDQVIRYIPPVRPSIMNCPEFFYRYGEKEQEAVSYFDFLDEMSTSTPSSGDFDEDHERDVVTASSNRCRKFYNLESSSDTDSISISDDKLLSPIVEESYDIPETCRHDHANGFCVSLLHTSQEDEVNRISFSDSCAESFSSSDHSFTNVE